MTARPSGAALDPALQELARAVGREAARFVADNRPEGRVQVSATKSSPTDAVTVVDEGCEQLIRDRILTARPDDGFVGEEGDDVAGSTGVSWIVDPIDGTVNFVYGIPEYAVSIAAARDGRVVAGHVINVVSGEEWGAVAGLGAWRHDADRRVMLRAPEPPSMSHALVGTGFSYVRAVRERQGAAVARLLPHVRDIRRTGSAALNLCSLADGRLDTYVEQGLGPWDRAAGGLVAQEAGMVLSGLDDVPDERLVMAAHPAIAEEFFALVRACGF